MIEKKFYVVLNSLSQESKGRSSFTGIGLVLYDPYILDHGVHSSLRPSLSLPEEITLYDIDKASDMLLEISDKTSRFHDGFHFFDLWTGKLSYPAQYFVPPIVPDLETNEDYGTRYHSALYGSCIDGVVLTGVINSDYKCHVFKKGNLITGEAFHDVEESSKRLRCVI